MRGYEGYEMTRYRQPVLLKRMAISKLNINTGLKLEG